MNDTLGKLVKRMREYNRDKAPGSECEAWQDFVHDAWCALTLDILDEDSHDHVVPAQFFDYWNDVANDVSTDYDDHGGGAW